MPFVIFIEKFKLRPICSNPTQILKNTFSLPPPLNSGELTQLGFGGGKQLNWKLPVASIEKQ
jgi:hypothetical protein